MPSSPNLSTTITAGSTGQIVNTNTVHGVVNNIYLASISVAKTSAYTLAQSNSGEVIPVDSPSAVTITVPILNAGTSVEILRLGAGAVNLSASGTTLVIPAGATATPRVQGSVLCLLWLTPTSVLVAGDLT